MTGTVSRSVSGGRGSRKVLPPLSARAGTQSRGFSEIFDPVGPSAAPGRTANHTRLPTAEGADGPVTTTEREHLSHG